jgi:YgiT-type zinc finger domain-containing protein
MQHFEGRSFTINTRGMIRDIPDIAGWECQACHEVEFDSDTDSAERYSDASDKLLMDARTIIAAEMKRIRRKFRIWLRNSLVRSCCGLSKNSFGVFCSTIWPWSMKITRLATCLGKAHLVGHAQHGHAFFGQLDHHVEHFLDHFGVERRGRLVEQHDLRLHAQRPGDRHALLLAAGQLPGILVRLLRDLDRSR